MKIADTSIKDAHLVSVTQSTRLFVYLHGSNINFPNDQKPKSK